MIYRSVQRDTDEGCRRVFTDEDEGSVSLVRRRSSAGHTCLTLASRRFHAQRIGSELIVRHTEAYGISPIGSGGGCRTVFVFMSVSSPTAGLPGALSGAYDVDYLRAVA
ncbi:hypothetical protein CBL_07142 [Carabus blaptoides fortunei]